MVRDSGPYETMRHLRLSLTDAAILIAIAGLLCAVPLHFRRYLDADDCRFRGALYLARGAELATMAENAEPWMDPFRADFRRLSAWQIAKGHRLFDSPRYDEAEERKRIAAAGMDRFEVAFRGLYRQFEAAAGPHGYRRPNVSPRYWSQWLFGAVFTGWPLYAGIALLPSLLIARRWPRDAADDRVRRWAMRGRIVGGIALLLLGTFAFLFSLMWAALSGDASIGHNGPTWADFLDRLFQPADGHAILTIFALAVCIVGITLGFLGRFELDRRLAEATRADGDGPAG
jgi:hypothetical protein